MHNIEKDTGIFKGTINDFREREGLRPIKTTRRDCICCGRPFDSKNRFHRLCPLCSRYRVGGVGVPLNTGHQVRGGGRRVSA